MGSSQDNQIRDYLQILKQDPRSRVFAPLAGLLLEGDNPTAALKVCQMGLEVNPDFSDGHLMRARVLAALGRPRDSLEAIKTVLKLNPKCADAYAKAAEVYLAAGQEREASAACMKAIDLDSENAAARELLKKIGRAGMLPGAGQPREQVKSTTREFRAVAGTMPSQRLSSKPPSPASLFGDALAEASQDAIERVSTEPQPFAAMSSGSQPAAPAEPGMPIEEFEVPTKPEKSRRVKAHSGTPIPRLPKHPEAPAPAPAPVPAQPAVIARVTPTGGAALAMVDEVQAVIDSYAFQPGAFEDGSRLKVPRSGRLKLVLGVVLALAALVAVIFLGTRSHRKRTAAALHAAKTDLAATAPVVTPLPPETEPVAAGQVEAQPAATSQDAKEAGAAEDAGAAVAAEDAGTGEPAADALQPEKAEKAAKKPAVKKKKRTKRRHKRRHKGGRTRRRRRKTRRKR